MACICPQYRIIKFKKNIFYLSKLKFNSFKFFRIFFFNSKIYNLTIILISNAI
nr:MAG TPA_asm: hypothetical protein [Caudoviricetes sp.]